MGCPGSVLSVPLGLGRVPLGGARTAGALTSVRIGGPESLSAYDVGGECPGTLMVISIHLGTVSMARNWRSFNNRSPSPIPDQSLEMQLSGPSALLDRNQPTAW